MTTETTNPSTPIGQYIPPGPPAATAQGANTQPVTDYPDRSLAHGVPVLSVDGEHIPPVAAAERDHRP